MVLSIYHASAHIHARIYISRISVYTYARILLSRITYAYLIFKQLSGLIPNKASTDD